MTDELRQEFEKAAAEVKELPVRPSDEDLLELYSLYKQATEGDVTGERPSFFDFAGGAKYDAWAGLEGTASEEAMRRYVAKVKYLQDA